MSVTRDKKKYGAPTVYSDKKREKEKAELRERELQEQLSKDLNEGRLIYGRRMPKLDEE